MTRALAPSTGVGPRVHRVQFQNPVASVPDGDGGFTQSWVDTSPATLMARIQAASVRDLERVTAGTILATATHIIDIPYHPQITTQSRVLYNGRIFNVVGITDPEERHMSLILSVVEVVT